MAHWITGQPGVGTKQHFRGARETTPEADEPTVLIVGAGTFGTSTAYHLAQTYKDASKVTIVDRDDSPPKPAAAVDINRVIRTDYASPMYGHLAYEAWHAWFWSLELQRFFHQTGWLMLDDTKDAELSTRIRQSFKARGWDPTEDIPLNELENRWGGMMKGTDLTGFNHAYFNEEVGWCDAAGATHSFMQTAEKKGVKRVTADVTELLFQDDHVVGVKTADGQERKADKVVVAAGAWTSSLFSPLEDTLQIPEKDRISRQIRTIGVLQAYYPASDSDIEQFEKRKMPIVIYGEQGEILPPHKNNKLIKYTHNNSFTNTITTKSGAKITAPTGSAYENQLNDIPEELKREAENSVLSRLLPQFTKDKKVDHWRICYDARTPTEDFLICKYPHEKLDNVLIASGGSSHSYKFLPNAGKYVVNVLNGKGNGKEKDEAWAWKEETWDVRDKSKEPPKLGAWTPKRELRSLGEIGGGKSKL